MISNPARRKEICRIHGFNDEVEIYRLIASAAKEGIVKLLRKGLRATTLEELGYDINNMRKIGYSESALKELGFIHEEKPLPIAKKSAEERLGKEIAMVQEMVRSDCNYGQFREKGFTVHHLRKAGCIISQLERLGFPLEDFVQAYSAAELRRSGYNVQDLKRHFSGQELRVAGFSATDMRTAGFAIRELQNFGYNENHIRTAGYSVMEMISAGLTRQVVDKTKFQ